MGTLILLTAEAAEKGFGLNFDLLEANVLNLAVVISVLVYFAKGFLGKALAERRSQIADAIQDAEKRVKEAAVALAEQEKKLQAAKAEAAKILADAETSAQSARAAILAQSEQDLARMRATAAQEMSNQQDKVMSELRQRVAALAMQDVEQRLRSQMGEDAQRSLIDRSIAQIGG
jgi:F-type H+-transporting ATPase subunit b